MFTDVCLHRWGQFDTHLDTLIRYINDALTHPPNPSIWWQDSLDDKEIWLDMGCAIQFMSAADSSFKWGRVSWAQLSPEPWMWSKRCRWRGKRWSCVIAREAGCGGSSGHVWLHVKCLHTSRCLGGVIVEKEGREAECALGWLHVRLMGFSENWELMAATLCVCRTRKSVICEVCSRSRRARWVKQGCEGEEELVRICCSTCCKATAMMEETEDSRDL